MTYPDYTLQARVVAAEWFNRNFDKPIDLQVLADDIKKAMESAHYQGEQMALAQCECQPELESDGAA